MWAMAIPIAAIVVVTFWSVTRNDFVNWDDDKNFINNPNYWGLGWAQLRWAWTTILLGVYQPVAWMLLEAQYSMFALDPRGYHLVSILLHVVNSVVLYALMIALIGRARPELLDHHPWKCFTSAAVMTTVFAVHPLRTEVVAWISCQPYLPCALFYLLAIAAYLRANPQNGIQDRDWFWRSYLLFVAALLSKAVAVSLPFVLLILDAYPLNRLSGGLREWFSPAHRRVWSEKLPFIGASIAVMVVATWAKRHEPILSAVQPRGLAWDQLVQAVYGAGFYVVKTLVPVGITAYYPLPPHVNWLDPSFLIYIVTAIVLTVGVFVLRRTLPAAMAAWITYLVVLGPNMGLIHISSQIAADRYGYIPLMGPFAMGAGLLASCWSRDRLARVVNVAVVPAALAAVIALVVLSQQQSRTWLSDEALWAHAIDHGSDVAEFHNFLGLALAKETRREEAKQQFTEAIRLYGEYADAHNNLGVVLLDEGRSREAGDHFAEAIRLKPGYAEAHNNLGTILLGERQVERAIREYVRSLELEPDNGTVVRNLRRVLTTTPPRDARLVDCVQAVLRNPTDKAAYRELHEALRSYQ